jgi:hypothetical protein
MTSARMWERLAANLMTDDEARRTRRQQSSATDNCNCKYRAAAKH